jgi:hypothetical protein
MNILPRVRELEERFADVMTVIGVHAGKFVTERVTERIAEACDRLDVVHAVVNDRQYRVWRDYAVQSWPTIVLIDPEGYLAAIEPGEFDVDEMARQIEGVIARAGARGTLVRGPGPVAVALPRHEGTLRFPTRAIVANDRLWVADTGHGRVLECSWDAGARAATLVAAYDGFAEPRGLTALDGHVYVADRRGHSVWQLSGGERVRVAGTGRLGSGPVDAGPALHTDLRSPWGLGSAEEGHLAIAMAGTHQLWDLRLATGVLSLVAGGGAEDVRDGSSLSAALAQPTGLASTPDGKLAFADCETSAVRVLDQGSVTTLVGTGLFEFGDRDGIGDEALLQHCEDVAVHGEGLAVADTYNDRLKRVDPRTRACAPWPWDAGVKDALREPGGVWSDGDLLLVSDTGHHRIAVVESDGSLAEVRFV